MLRAMRDAGGQPDPLSVTVHFLRPLQPDGTEVDVAAEVVRRGRTVSVLRGAMSRSGGEVLVASAVFGDLTAAGTVDERLAPGAPAMPPPEECVDRGRLAQGVTLPLLERVDVRIDPACAEAGSRADAVMQGWIRFRDGAAVDSLALPLLADAFPPALLTRLGPVGWVPTVELTVHVRSRPATDWVAARFECDDLAAGPMIESGSLCAADGTFLARSRQLGLVLPTS